jgi:hypothetical protein
MSEKHIMETLVRIEKRIEEIDRKCDAVTAHASFVEGVYETLRSPLNYITGYVNLYMPLAVEDDLPYPKKYKSS